MTTRNGFSLVEVVIAAFIFAIGALALEATAAPRVVLLRTGIVLARDGGAADVRQALER